MTYESDNDDHDPAKTALHTTSRLTHISAGER
jgi:hypothetical protein